MSLVAFDLDNTLGYFDLIAPWGEMFSLELLENSVNLQNNPGFHLTTKVRILMREMEKKFIEIVESTPIFMDTLLRPNLDALLVPLIRAKRVKQVRAVCIYSNSSSIFKLKFAKLVIEHKYRCPGFFDCLVDSVHPIRNYDWRKREDGRYEPLKTFATLKRIFKDLCGVKSIISPEDILFVDDRNPKHHLANDEKFGLTYLKPTAFSPPISQMIYDEFYSKVMLTFHKMGAFNDIDYISSHVFDCVKYDVYSKEKTRLHGMFQLLRYIEHSMEDRSTRPTDFKDDSKKIQYTIAKFLVRKLKR